MFVELQNTPRPYAWGSPTAIAKLQGREPSGEPEAELWLGAHEGSPARLADGSGAGTARRSPSMRRTPTTRTLSASPRSSSP